MIPMGIRTVTRGGEKPDTAPGVGDVGRKARLEVELNMFYRVLVGRLRAASEYVHIVA